MALTAVAGRAADEGYQAWLQQRDALLRDSSLVRRYTFAEVKTSADIVKDLTGNGGTKRAGRFCWVATGSSIWRVDNAGVIEFVGAQE